MDPLSPVVAAGQDFLYLRKPAGLPVFPPHADPEGDCLLARLLLDCPGAERAAGGPWPEGFAGGILHRLDNGTSGLVVAARGLAALERGRAAFQSHLLRKRYLFLTRGEVPWTEHHVTRPLAHDRRRRARMVVQRGRNTPHRGRWYDAETWLEHERTGPPHLWRATISTGVMHQIRLHAAVSGLPILGDRLYGGGTHPAGFFLHHERIDGWLEDCPTVGVPAAWPAMGE